jgi:hypothetical protein
MWTYPLRRAVEIIRPSAVSGYTGLGGWYPPGPIALRKQFSQSLLCSINARVCQAVARPSFVSAAPHHSRLRVEHAVNTVKLKARLLYAGHEHIRGNVVLVLQDTVSVDQQQDCVERGLGCRGKHPQRDVPGLVNRERTLHQRITSANVWRCRVTVSVLGLQQGDAIFGSQYRVGTIRALWTGRLTGGDGKPNQFEPALVVLVNNNSVAFAVEFVGTDLDVKFVRVHQALVRVEE